MLQMTENPIQTILNYKVNFLTDDKIQLQAQFSGPHEVTGDLVSGCVQCWFLPQMLQCLSPVSCRAHITCQEHLLTAPTQAQRFTVSQRLTLGHRLIPEHPVYTGSKRTNWVTAPKFMFWEQEKVVSPKKSEVCFRGRTRYWAAKTNGHYRPPPRKGWGRQMGKENLPLQICVILFLTKMAFY